MTSTWDALRERNSVVRTIVDRAAEGTTTESRWTGVAGVWDHFDDETHLLRELQQHWFHSLAASVDNALETGDGNLLEDVRRAYASAAQRHLGLRRILDEYADHPALVPLVRREHALLATAAGVAHSDEITKVFVAVPKQRRRSFFAKLFSAA